MKTTALTVLLFFIIVSATGQNDSISLSADSTSQRQYTKKNELYLNVSPALIPMVGGSSELVKYSIKYKRRDKNLNHAFRIGFNYIKTADPVSYKQYTYDNDSTMILQKTASFTSSNIWIDFGWEFVKYYKRFEQFYGADLVLGHYENNTSVHQEVYSLNNNLYMQSYYENIDYGQTEDRIGISPFVGLKYHISQYFSFAIQAGVDVSYNMIRATSTKSGNTDYSSIDFRLGTPAFINDVSLVYSF